MTEDSLIIRKTPIKEVLDSAELLARYAREAAIAGMPAPTAKLGMYDTLEKKGALSTFGAFHDEKLVGFITVLCSVLPHYSELTAVVESFFVDKEARRTGAGFKLLYAAEKLAKEKEVVGLLVSAPTGGALAEVLPRSGYRQTNVVFFKGFKDA